MRQVIRTLNHRLREIHLTPDPQLSHQYDSPTSLSFLVLFLSGGPISPAPELILLPVPMPLNLVLVPDMVGKLEAGSFWLAVVRFAGVGVKTSAASSSSVCCKPEP